jgi:hypothetical protein
MAEVVGYLIGNAFVAVILGWILMLSVGAIGLGWGFWPCFGIAFVVVLVASYIRGD